MFHFNTSELKTTTTKTWDLIIKS